MTVDLFTIGTTKSTAERFFGRLAKAGVRTVVDIRTSNRSQLAGFAKMPDLAFFLERVAGIVYRAEPLLVPPLEMMRAYRQGTLSWNNYRRDYRALLSDRPIAGRLGPEDFDHACLLCSEASAERCHRGIAAAYLEELWPGAVKTTHL